MNTMAHACNRTGRRVRGSQGFTLVEMVGVLAIIAILAALLVPKVMSAIDEARRANTVVGCNTAKTALVSYFAKYGSFSGLPADNADQTLLTEGFLESPFTTKVGVSPDLKRKAVNNAEPVWGKLDGNALAASGNVVYVALGAIPVSDAYELSQRIDGDLSAANLTSSDDKGRVIYTYAADTGLATTYIYLAHK